MYLLNNNLEQPEKKPTRDGFGVALCKLAPEHPELVALCADLTESTRLLAFKQQFPKQFVEMGIQEQNMAGVAAGLAQEGLIPWIASYAVFSPGRNWDQVRVSICYNNANVKIAGAHSGVSVGPDGATHQALEDIAITRVLPGMTVIAPCDALETERAVIAATLTKGPMYVRFAREATPIITTPETEFAIGKAYIVREGSDVTIFSTGPQLYDALKAADTLKKENVSIEVVHCPTIKPLDTETIIKSAQKTKAGVTIEEHQIHAGFGSAIAECLVASFPIPLEFVGMPDSFGQSGTPTELLTHYGITSDALIIAVKKVIARK